MIELAYFTIGMACLVGLLLAYDWLCRQHFAGHYSDREVVIGVVLITIVGVAIAAVACVPEFAVG